MKKIQMKKRSTTTTSCSMWRFTPGEPGGPYTPSDRWDREDGAVVKYSKDYYWANPVKKGHRGWIAFGPLDDHALGFTHRESRKTIHRRWKTAASAMDYIDQAYKLGSCSGVDKVGPRGQTGLPGIP